jgi:hypothetical protein
MKVLLLRKTGSTWCLIAPAGHTVAEFYRCSSKELAYAEARAWASSWSDIDIRFEDEQDPKRN